MINHTLGLGPASLIKAHESDTVYMAEQYLISEVIIRAIHDVCPRKQHKALVNKNHAADARRWLNSNNTEAWSFLWCLEQINPDKKTCLHTARVVREFISRPS